MIDQTCQPFILTFEAMPSEIIENILKRLPGIPIFLVCTTWNQFLEVEKKRVEWVKYLSDLQTNELFREIEKDSLIPKNFSKIIARANLYEYTKHSHSKKIEHDILPSCNVAVKVISNLFSHTDSSNSGGLKLSWEEPGFFWNKQVDGNFFIKTLIDNFYVDLKKSSLENERCILISKRVHIFIFSDPKINVPTGVIDRFSSALQLHVEECAFYNFLQLSHLKSVHELEAYSFSCNSFGRLGNGQYSFKITVCSVDLNLEKKITTLVWEETLPVARWFEGPMSIRNRVFYLTTELLSERFKLEKLELPSSAFSIGP